MSLPRYRIQSRAEMHKNGRMSTVTKDQESSNKRVTAVTPSLKALQEFLDRPMPWENEDERRPQIPARDPSAKKTDGV
jgi:hypothetical protein